MILKETIENLIKYVINCEENIINSINIGKCII